MPDQNNPFGFRAEEIAQHTQLQREEGFSVCDRDKLALSAENFNAVFKWLDTRVLALESKIDYHTRATEIQTLGQFSIDLTQTGQNTRTGSALTIQNPRDIHVMNGLFFVVFDAEWNCCGEGRAEVVLQTQIGSGAWVNAGTMLFDQKNADANVQRSEQKVAIIDTTIDPEGSKAIRGRVIINKQEAFSCESSISLAIRSSGIFSNSAS